MYNTVYVCISECVCVCVCAHARSSIHVHVYNSNYRGCGISNFFLVLISEDLACYVVMVIKKFKL